LASPELRPHGVLKVIVFIVVAPVDGACLVTVWLLQENHPCSVPHARSKTLPKVTHDDFKGR